MAQQGKGTSPQPVNSLDEEIQAYHSRMEELTANGKMTRLEASHLLRKEDNEKLVKMNTEKVTASQPTSEQQARPDHSSQYGRLGKLTPEQLARRDRLRGSKVPEAENVHGNQAGRTPNGRGRGDD